MSAISSLFLAACSEYGLSKIDTGEFTPPEQDSAVTPPEPTDTGEPRVETDSPSDSGRPFDTGEPLDTEEPPAPSANFSWTISSCFNITENACPINESTGSLDAECLDSYISQEDLLAAAETLLPDGTTFEDLIAGNVPVTGYVSYQESSYDSNSDGLANNIWKNTEVRLAIGDYYDELDALNSLADGSTWPVGFIYCGSSWQENSESPAHSEEEPYIVRAAWNSVFASAGEYATLENHLSFVIEGMGGAYDTGYSGSGYRTKIVKLNWNYDDGTGFVEADDVESEECFIEPCHDLSTSENEAEADVADIQDMALSYLGGEGSGLFLYTP